MTDTSKQTERSQLPELARLFLKLGTIGFGGPQAHIAMQNDEVVVRRQWLTAEQFSEGLAVCEMLPGPASTQLGIYIGYLRAGQIGALVAGLCFIAPAFVILVALSWMYFRFQSVPQVEFLFLGISPVVTAIILGFCWKLGKRTIRDWSGVAIALVTFFALWLLKFNILLLFITAGLVGLGLYRPRPTDTLHDRRSSHWLFPVLPSLSSVLATATATGDVLALSSFWGIERVQDFALPLFLFFLRVGSFIFGGGLVIIPLLEYDVVERLQWLTQTEFINGVAIGQLTPGPVVLTAAFVGFKVAGILGALIAAIAIFLPSFAFIMLASPLLVRVRQNPWIRAFLRGVTSAVLGAIAAAAIPLAQTAIVQESVIQSAIAVVIAVLALVALIRYKTPTWQLVPAGATIGLIAGIALPSLGWL
jgi:chromate transporter